METLLVVVSLSFGEGCAQALTKFIGDCFFDRSMYAVKNRLRDAKAKTPEILSFFGIGAKDRIYRGKDIAVPLQEFIPRPLSAAQPGDTPT